MRIKRFNSIQFCAFVKHFATSIVYLLNNPIARQKRSGEGEIRTFFSIPALSCLIFLPVLKAISAV